MTEVSVHGILSAYDDEHLLSRRPETIMMQSKLGVPLVKLKTLIFSIAAMLMAVTGLVYAAGPTVAPVVEGPVGAWSVPYNPASAGMVSGLQGFLQTETGAGLLAQVPSLSIISTLSPDSEVHRRIVGAMALPAGFESQLQAALKTSDNKAMTGALVTILSAYHSQNVEGKISEAVQARAEVIAAAVSNGKMSVAELSAASSELAPFTSISAKAKAVEEMASAARTSNTMDAAKRVALNFGQPRDEATSDQGRVAVEEPASSSSRGKTSADRRAAKDLLDELARADNISYSKGIVDRLRAMAENKQEEGLQRVIVRGLVADMPRRDDVGYRKYVVDALEAVAAKTTFESIQLTIIQMVMADIPSADNVSYSKKVVDSVERIGSNSSSGKVKDYAISQMMGQAQQNDSASYGKFLLAKIDSVRNSAGKAGTVPPAPSKQKRPTVAGWQGVTDRVVAGWKELTAQASEGISNHPVGAFFALLALASTVVTMGLAHFPIIGIAGLVAAFLFIATKGLWTDHPVATFFQLAVISDLFETVAKTGATLSTGPIVGLIAAGVLGAIVAHWSFKKDHPVLGFFLNAVLMWMLQAVITGSTGL